MRVVTIVSLGASAVLGLAALFVAKAVLPSATTARMANAIAPPVTGVPVVAARSDLKYGDRLDAGKLTILHLPANAVPQGAFTTIAQVLAQDHGGPPAVLVPISAKEPLLPAKISGPGARASIAAEIADGLRAYTIKVTDITGVGGHALPGDRVDVVMMRDLTPEGNVRSYVSEVVVQDIRVLGVDLNVDQVANKPAAPTTATLEVTVPDAQKLAVAGTLGTLSLALRKTGAGEFAQTTVMRPSNFSKAGGPGNGHSGPPRPFAGDGFILIVEGGRNGHTRTLPPLTAPAAVAPVAPVAPGALPAAASAAAAAS